MKKLNFLLLFTVTICSAKAQQGVAINTNGAVPDSKSILDISSTSKGVLIPRMTAIQRIAIAPTATQKGMLVFDIDSSAFIFWTGAAWQKINRPINPGDASFWSNGGNDIFNNNTGSVGIGTNTLKAGLHVGADKNVLFGGDTNGAGAKFLWLPSKRAFRAGMAGPVYNFENDTFYDYGDSLAWNYDSIGHFSFAGGFSNNAKGNSSTSFGAYNQSRGDMSTTFGVANRADGYYSLAAGGNNQTVGMYSIALGYNSKALTDYAIAIGSSVQASGERSFATGFSTKAQGENSTAMGYVTRAIGENSFAIGSGNSSEGEASFSGGWGSNHSIGASSFTFGISNRALHLFSTAFGYLNTAKGELSSVFGWQNNASSYASMVIGRFNDTIVGSDPDNWVSGDPVFIIGNGTDQQNRKNALTILKSGKTGLGTSTPDGLLHVRYNGNSSNPQIVIEESTTDYSRISFKNTNPGYWNIGAYSKNALEGNDAARMSFAFSGLGNVLSLKGNGDANLAGTLTQFSDERLKRNIHPLTSTLDKIMQLNGYTYQWKDPLKGDDIQIGFLAQEIEKQFPQLVSTDEKGMKSVAYSNMVPVLLQAIKEQQQQIDELKKLIMGKVK